MLGSGAQLAGGPEGPLRVVLVGHGHPEDSQHGIAAELGHGPTVARAHRSSRCVVSLEHGAEGLRVQIRGSVRTGEL